MIYEDYSPQRKAYFQTVAGAQMFIDILVDRNIPYTVADAGNGYKISYR